MTRNTPAGERIVIFAHKGPNLKVIMDVLAESGLACSACDTAGEFCGLLDEGAGAGIIFNDVLAPPNTACTRQFLQSQPPWSDLAIILLISDLSMQRSYREMFGSHRNIITLEMPIHPSALVDLLRTLLQARQRQYESRDLIHELQRTKEELLVFKTDLENKNKELEIVIGIVSHDLRAPLVNVKGFANEISKDCALVRDTLQKEPSCQEALKKLAPVFDSFPESIHFIISSADAMNNLATSLVSIARAGLEAITPQQINMNEIVEKVVSSIQFKFKQNDVSYDVDADLPQCFGDKNQITQIFTNLLDNAIKYLDPNRPGQICVSCDLEAGHALYSVSDNGIGISPQDQEKIFDPYYQLHEKAAGGVGMGLAMVKRMVDRNNGRIQVYSEKGHFTIFYVALPISPPPSSLKDSNTP